MTPTNNPEWLGRASWHACERLWTLGAVFKEFARMEGGTYDEVANFLGCGIDTLQWLSLCRRPAADHFADDIARIAEKFPIEPAKLAQLVRQVEAVAALRHATSEEMEVLLAARDREEDKDL